jgi:hypothetical protein
VGVSNNAMDHDTPLGAVGRCRRAFVLQMPIDASDTIATPVTCVVDDD